MDDMRKLYEKAKKFVKQYESRHAPKKVRRKKPKPVPFEQREQVGPPNDETVTLRITPQSTGQVFEITINLDQFEDLMIALRSKEGAKLSPMRLGRTRTFSYKYPRKVEQLIAGEWVRVDRR